MNALLSGLDKKDLQFHGEFKNMSYVSQEYNLLPRRLKVPSPQCSLYVHTYKTPFDLISVLLQYFFLIQ